MPSDHRDVAGGRVVDISLFGCQCCSLIATTRQDLSDPHWRRERATTLLLVVVSKHNLAQVKLRAQGKSTRGVFRSQPP